MWETVSNIAAIVVIILLLELLGIPDWIDKRVGKQRKESPLTKKVQELEARVETVERRLAAQK